MANNTSAWFARVPTEANIADLPSRFQLHPFFETGSNDSDKAAECLKVFLAEVNGAKQMKRGKRGEVIHLSSPHVSKKSSRSAAALASDFTMKLFEENPNGVGTAKTSHSRVQFLLGQGWSAVGSH